MPQKVAIHVPQKITAKQRIAMPPKKMPRAQFSNPAGICPPAGFRGRMALRELPLARLFPISLFYC
jgi:hypothetical protein